MRVRSICIFFLTTVVFVGACRVEDPPASRPPANTLATPEPSPSATQDTVTEAPDKNAPATMPIISALLNDDSFVADARSSVKLTDQEIEKLRSAADESITQLDESEGAKHSATTSSDQAKEQLRQILGQERGDKLIALVQKKWSGEPAGAPNSVPTDTRVVVNIPEFRMDVFDKGKLAKTYQIGIGYPEFPLPTGIRKAKQIIVNPTWTPPDEPWVKGKVQPHKTVEAGSKLNPLGPLKIPIGAPNLIHGGKNPAKIGNFASHGCVGLTNQGAEDFAVLFSNIAGKPITLQDLKGYEKAKTETKNIEMTNEVPVELRYETIVVENGTLKVFRDVYERGTNTEQNLRRVLQVYGVTLDQLDQPTRDRITSALQQMNTDATGGPVGGAHTNQNTSTNKNSGAKDGSKDVKITRAVKGEKVIEIPVPQLAGKGYPAAVS